MSAHQAELLMALDAACNQACSHSIKMAEEKLRQWETAAGFYSALMVRDETRRDETRRDELSF